MALGAPPASQQSGERQQADQRAGPPQHRRQRAPLRGGAASGACAAAARPSPTSSTTAMSRTCSRRRRRGRGASAIASALLRSTPSRPLSPGRRRAGRTAARTSEHVDVAGDHDRALAAGSPGGRSGTRAPCARRSPGTAARRRTPSVKTRVAVGLGQPGRGTTRSRPRSSAARSGCAAGAHHAKTPVPMKLSPISGAEDRRDARCWSSWL